MRRRAQHIEIQEPPLREINKKRSCLRRSCTTGCGCIVLFVVFLVFVFRLVFVSAPKELKYIPEHFPKSIPVYDQDNVTNISFVSGKQKGRVIQTAAYIPRLLLSPFKVILDKDTGIDNKDAIAETGIGLDDVVDFIENPEIDAKDIVQIDWEDLAAEPFFIIRYYETRLKNTGYTIKGLSRNEEVSKLRFAGKDGEGELFIKDDLTKPGTDFASLTVSIPSPEK
jgi:hypothetical protein